MKGAITLNQIVIAILQLVIPSNDGFHPFFKQLLTDDSTLDANSSRLLMPGKYLPRHSFAAF